VGVGQQPQVVGLRRGVDVLVACPGRLLDLMGQGHVDLGSVEITVLDEADHMADLGFLPAVRRILEATPAKAQRLLFSATLDAGVSVLVKRFLTNPVTHEADSAQSPVSTMDHHVLQVTAADRLPVLVDLASAPGRSIVFTRTKHGAKKLTKQLNASGVPAVELHGNLSQNARTLTMERFQSGTASTLVATDIAARGIHVDDVAMVIHADPPTEHKAYLHRSGRTARAGAEGLVLTLATDDQMRDVRELARKAGVQPTTTRVHPTHPLLRELAPGARMLLAPVNAPATQHGPNTADPPVKPSQGENGHSDRTQGGGTWRGWSDRNQTGSPESQAAQRSGRVLSLFSSEFPRLAVRTDLWRPVMPALRADR
jgi:superfamily II DNA/RNA helicase